MNRSNGQNQRDRWMTRQDPIVRYQKEKLRRHRPSTKREDDIRNNKSKNDEKVKEYNPDFKKTLKDLQAQYDKFLSTNSEIIRNCAVNKKSSKDAASNQAIQNKTNGRQVKFNQYELRNAGIQKQQNHNERMRALKKDIASILKSNSFNELKRSKKNRKLLPSQSKMRPVGMNEDSDSGSLTSYYTDNEKQNHIQASTMRHKKCKSIKRQQIQGKQQQIDKINEKLKIEISGMNQKLAKLKMNIKKPYRMKVGNNTNNGLFMKVKNDAKPTDWMTNIERMYTDIQDFAEIKNREWDNYYQHC